MPQRIDPTTWADYAACERLFDVVAAAGGEMRFVGGCVRDTLLGRRPGDRDMAVTFPPERMMQLLSAAGIRVIPTGLAHGTVTALVDGVPYEITTLREDVETDGRRATVRFTDDWRQDAGRRDFTMNALSCGLDGVVHDYFGGAEDARAGRLRFIGDAMQRISEDALRILRFFRFFAWYGQPPYDMEAIRACAASAALLDGLSGERVQAEMLKLLAAPEPAGVLDTMGEIGLLSHLGLTANNLYALPRLSDPFLRLAALMHGQDTSSLASRWRLSNHLRDRLAHLTRVELSAAPALKPRLRKLGKELFLAEAQVVAALTGSDATSSLELAETWTPPLFPLDGRMLQEAGIPPGKALGDTLRRLEAMWEASDYTLTADRLMQHI